MPTRRTARHGRDLRARGRRRHADPSSVDAHSMSPAVVLGLLAGLGGHVAEGPRRRLRAVTVDEGIGLSEPVVGGGTYRPPRSFIESSPICTSPQRRKSNHDPQSLVLVAVCRSLRRWSSSRSPTRPLPQDPGDVEARDPLPDRCGPVRVWIEAAFERAPDTHRGRRARRLARPRDRRRRSRRRPDRAAGKLEFPVENLKSGNAFEDRELRRRIDARRYPTIIGELKSMKHGRSDRPTTSCRGDLTFRGVTTHVRGQDDDRGRRRSRRDPCR